MILHYQEQKVERTLVRLSLAIMLSARSVIFETSVSPNSHFQDDRLSKELKKLQLHVGIQAPQLNELHIPEGKEFSEVEEFAFIMNSSYYMSPLLTAYDDHLYNVEKELSVAHMEIHHLNDHIQGLVNENEVLSDKLHIKIMEHGKLIGETIKNSDVLSDFEQEKAALDKRNALLSEENQILFEQVSMLKKHFDEFNENYSSKVAEADDKIAAFDRLHEQLLSQIDSSEKARGYLEAQLREKDAVLSTVEGGRENEKGELQKRREEVKVLQNELAFYKEQSERMNDELRQTQRAMETQIREVKAKEIDRQEQSLRSQDDVERVEKINKQLEHNLRIAKADLRALTQVNDDYKHQITLCKDREEDALRSTTQLKEETEKIEFEKDKLKLREETINKEIETLREQYKTDMAKNAEKLKQSLRAKQQIHSSKYDELEEKYLRQVRDYDSLKISHEREIALNRDLQRELDKKARTKSTSKFDNEFADLKRNLNEKELEIQRLISQREMTELQLEKLRTEQRETEKKFGDDSSDSAHKISNLEKEVENLRELKIINETKIGEAEANKQLLLKELRKSKEEEQDFLAAAKRAKENDAIFYKKEIELTKE